MKHKKVEEEVEQEEGECWLCLYQNDDEAKRVIEFVTKSVGYIDIGNISSQVSTFIHTRYTAPINAEGQPVPLLGADAKDIYRHITKHILHPRVRIAVILKDLLDFSDHLHNNLVVEDEHSGLTAVDKGNVELYLKVISQITTLYKVETSTMLFGSEETAA